VYWLNYRELEIDQHHIITPHCFCGLSNSVLKCIKKGKAIPVTGREGA
jgi:hypothetical protein